MSRSIKTNVSHIDEQECALRDTGSGKLLFTRYHRRMCAFYLRGNRLLAAQALSDTDNKIGAVYIGKVKKIVKNIEACFLEIANGEICFLALKDSKNPILLNRTYDGRILEGDEILVQISKEAQKTKQTSVTADISLTNEYAAVAIGSRRVGYSGKLSKTQKEQIKEYLTEAGFLDGSDFKYNSMSDGLNADISTASNHTAQMQFPLGLVVRTKAGECTKEVLIHNIELLLQEFLSMLQIAYHRTCFSCIRQAPQEFETILDQLVYPYEYHEILTDQVELYHKLCLYTENHLPGKSVRLYEDETFCLSKLYSLEQKMESALNKRIWLKSGGYLIIEPTEALTVIDVNTGKYEGKRASQGFSAPATFEIINREAAEEIALQLRLRNLSGIILVDFINMESKESENSLLEHLRSLLRKDKIKANVIDITPLGLVEITRKKRNKPLHEQFC